MANMSNEDIAQVLADISNKTQRFVKTSKDPQAAAFARALTITINDWLETRPEELCELYDNKLQLTGV